MNSYKMVDAVMAILDGILVMWSMSLKNWMIMNNLCFI